MNNNFCAVTNPVAVSVAVLGKCNLIKYINLPVTLSALSIQLTLSTATHYLISVFDLFEPFWFSHFANLHMQITLIGRCKQ